MNENHDDNVQDDDKGRDDYVECGALQDANIAQFVTTLGYPLSPEQISTLGSFTRESQPSLRALRTHPAVPTTQNPFETATGYRSSTSSLVGGRQFSGPKQRPRSAREGVAEAIQQLRVVDADFSTTISFLEQRALELAEESDRRTATGEERVLEGAPFTVKDVIDVAGARTTGGSLSQISSAPARKSAAVITRLERAGAIPIAKDSTTEFASGGMDTPLKGVCRNPWNTARWSGGSSSGTAVAVAGGAVTFGIGTDVSGSVRMPAAFCGLTGLKPTLRRLPQSGVIPMSWSTEVVGPLARDARTLAAVFSVMSAEGTTVSYKTGHDSGGATQTTDLSNFKVAIPRDELFTNCDSSVLQGLDAMSETLSSLGATTFEIEIPNAALAHDAGFQIIYPEALTIHDPHFADWGKYDGFTVDRLGRGVATSAHDYLRAKQLGVRLQEDLLEVFNHADAILVPTAPAAAPTISDSTMKINGKKVPSYAYQSRIAMISSLTGFPALTLPTGFDSSGCPVAATLITRPYREDTALYLAEVFQSVTGYHLCKPVAAE